MNLNALLCPLCGAGINTANQNVDDKNGYFCAYCGNRFSNDVIDFEYENMSEEEFEAKLNELFTEVEETPSEEDEIDTKIEESFEEESNESTNNAEDVIEEKYAVVSAFIKDSRPASFIFSKHVVKKLYRLQQLP